MNVQFSLSASSVSTNQKTDNLTLLSEKQDVSIKSEKDLILKESQGVNVSIAEEQLIQTIERAVKSLQGPQTILEISIHQKTHDIMVKILNKDTGELIREVPPEKTLDLVANMMEIAGILIDQKV